MTKRAFFTYLEGVGYLFYGSFKEAIASFEAQEIPFDFIMRGPDHPKGPDRFFTQNYYND